MVPSAAEGRLSKTDAVHQFDVTPKIVAGPRGKTLCATVAQARFIAQPNPAHLGQLRRSNGGAERNRHKQTNPMKQVYATLSKPLREAPSDSRLHFCPRGAAPAWLSRDGSVPHRVRQ